LIERRGALRAYLQVLQQLLRPTSVHLAGEKEGPFKFERVYNLAANMCLVTACPELDCLNFGGNPEFPPN